MVICFHKKLGNLQLPVKLYYNGIKYTLTSKLGRGRDGTAFIAHTKQDEVVVKIYSDDGGAVTEAFDREARGLKITLRLIHADTENRILIFKMIPGITFAQYIEEMGVKFQSASELERNYIIHKLNDKVNDYFSSIREFNHRYGLIHGDVRPLNVVITPDDNMELIDLGSCDLSPVDVNEFNIQFQKQSDMAKLELFYYVSLWFFRDSGDGYAQHRHLLITKSIPGRDQEAEDYCKSLELKSLLPDGYCDNLELEYQNLREKVIQLFRMASPSIQEMNSLGEKLKEKFMMIEQGYLKVKIASMNGMGQRMGQE